MVKLVATRKEKEGEAQPRDQLPDNAAFIRRQVHKKLSIRTPIESYLSEEIMCPLRKHVHPRGGSHVDGVF